MAKPISVAKYEELKREADKAQREADKAQGALDTLMATLQKDFDCSTIEAAEELLVELEAEAAEAEELFERALKKFETRWGEALRERE